MMQKMENLHVYKDYHDISINGIYHDKSQNILKLLCDNSQEIIFSNILQFEFNFFSDQNVIFEINSYKTNELPVPIMEDYPFLKNYINTDLLIFYINSSVGLSGVIICENKYK